MQVGEPSAGTVCAYKVVSSRNRVREIWCERKNRWTRREERAGIEVFKQQVASEFSSFCWVWGFFLFLEKKNNEKEQRIVARKRNDRKGKGYGVAESQRERTIEAQRCKVQEQDIVGS